MAYSLKLKNVVAARFVLVELETTFIKTFCFNSIIDDRCDPEPAVA